MNQKITLKSILLLSTLSYCYADDSFKDELNQNCITDTAKELNLDPVLLLSIARQESNYNPRAYNKNKNGSYDVGFMQINSLWSKHLSKQGISSENLYEVCVNVKAAAWILDNNFKDFGKNWHSIGVYHAGTRKGEAFSKRRKKYAHTIYNHWAYLRVRPNKQKEIYEKLFYGAK